MNILKIAELVTLNGWILLYNLYISILKRKKEMIQVTFLGLTPIPLTFLTK